MPAGPAAPGRVEELLARTLARIGEHYPWESIALGRPTDGGPWVALDELAAADATDRVMERLLAEPHYETTPRAILGNYLFRFALSAPLRAAGSLFIAERRVLELAGNVLYLDRDWLQHARLLEARLWVLPEDELAREAGARVVADLDALTDRLFAEVEPAFGPLLAAYRARRFVATGNAWGSILDGLAAGVLYAISAGITADEAWGRWDRAIAGRPLPGRRRPARFSYAVDGEALEMIVRAGCCLYYVTPPAHSGGERYCTSCYLIDDEERLRRATAQHRAYAQARQESGASG